MTQYLNNFPPGPLDYYRHSASFDWKQLRIFLDTEEVVEFENYIFNELQKYPEFIQHPIETPALDEIRRRSAKRMFFIKYKVDPLYTDALFHPLKRLSMMCNLYALDANSAVKHGLAFEMFWNVLQTLGTERHEHYVERVWNGDILGCFCLTEVGHGSNTKGMKTTATYDAKSKQFILNTPDFESAKCWSGNLGQTATHAIIFAHLITPDGKRHGLHPFIVNVRDPNTMLAYPGITIRDIGEKVGLNGVDNGLIMLDHYRISRENLLNRVGDVTEDGKYVTPYKDPNRRHGASLGTLSNGRVAITAIGSGYLIKAVTIAIRYAGVRKQFSADDLEEEMPILEYQSLQYRLLPYLAVSYALKIFCMKQFRIQSQFIELLFTERNHKDLPGMGMEIHAISSACKPLSTWTARDAIQECREACGGHGYLKVAGFGELRNNNDPSCTYEGENHVLIQQTSNWLLKFWPLVLQGQVISTPFQSLDFLNKANEILQWKFVGNSVKEIIEPKHILNTFQWLTCYSLKLSYEKFQYLLQNSPYSNLSSKTFWAKNKSQVFFAKTLAIVYVQHFILQQMYEKISEAENLQIKKVLLNLFSLYGMWSLEKHIPVLYRGGYATTSNVVALIHDAILTLCAALKNDAVSLVDAIAQPDFIINSALGYSDGQVYKHLEEVILKHPAIPSRPTWWEEIATYREEMKAKL